MLYIFNANYILFSHVVRNIMFGTLERLCAYRKDPTHSLDEHIHMMYNKLRTFHVTYNEHYVLSVEQYMWIVLDSLLDSWEHERNALTRRINNLTYHDIVSELNQELERWIQSSIWRSSRSMNTFPWMNKMFETLTLREFVMRECSIHPDDE